MKQKTPTEVVQAQADAYNQRDIQKFADCFSETVQFINLPNHDLRFEGKTLLIEKFKALFESSPAINLVIKNRMAFGNYVIDHESITGASSAPNGIEAVTINHVENGLIQKIWFAK